MHLPLFQRLGQGGAGEPGAAGPTAPIPDPNPDPMNWLN
jgi:hypothetical protein